MADEPPTTANADHAALVRAAEALRPLHSKRGPPKPGEWLAMHKEAGQTFEDYF